MPTYSVASVALSVVPDMRGFFTDVNRAVDRAPTPRIKPEVDGKQAEADMGKGGRFGAGMLAAGAALGVAVGAAVIGAMDVSKAQSKLAAQLGGSDPQFAKDMGRIAGQVYSQAWGDSLETVNDAVRNVVQSGAVMEDASNEQIQSITTNVLALADAFGVDVAESTRAIGQMVKTGLVPDAQTATDVITRMFQQFGPGAEDVLDTFTEYSVQFQTIGLDAQTAGGIIAQMMDAGARNTDLAADALKEFAIRSVDGSKLTTNSFKAIGLNADEMRRRLSAGGPEAQAAFAQVVEALKSVEDPALRTEAAVGLFGTQAEDLQGALLAIDPTTAVNGLGNVQGAATRMADELGNNSAARIESFKRSLQTGISDFIGGTLLPAFDSLTAAGSNLFGAQWDGVRSFLGFLLTTGGAVVGIILAIAGAVKLWGIAQGILDIVMKTSATGLWIIGIVALVAAVIYAWNNFNWFRDAVMAVWEFLKRAGAWIADVFVAIWGGLSTAFRAVGDVFSWVWSSVLSPVFGFLAKAAGFVAAVVLTVLITPLLLAWKILGAVFSAVWNSVLKPVFDFFARVASWLWTVVLAPTFRFIGDAFRMLGTFFMWVWNSVLKPVFDFFGQVAQFVWNSILRPTFDFIMRGFRALGDLFMWVYNSLIKPAWDAISRAAQWAWNNVIRPVFDTLKSGVDSVGRAFQSVSEWIGRSWNSIKEAARRPVQWVVDFVYNNGIRKVWNGIAGVFNMPQLGEVRFAGGGVLPGYAPGVDSVRALLSPGEAVLVPELVRAIGPANILALNHEYSGGRKPGSTGRARFAGGGLVGNIWDFVSGGAGFVSDLFTKGPVKAVRELFSGVLGERFNGPGSQFVDALTRIPGKVVDAVIAKAKDYISGIGSGVMSGIGNLAAGFIGGSGVQRWSPVVLQALAMMGQPASFLGITLRRMNQESGGNPRAINMWDVNARRGTPSMGLMQVIPPTFAANRDPRAVNNIWDPLANILASMRYALRRYGSLPAAYNKPGGYDSGGWLMPGLQQVYNGTGKPEAVFTSEQWKAIKGNVFSGGDTYYVTTAESDPDAIANSLFRKRNSAMRARVVV